ncbi:hypothetical protein [Azospirillum sp. ST 5-10]|uniref:hypothetical protein n=1 Tax=unclassified Azospirillum TaxID=2630922 RepID=UPI003F4A1F89
MKPLPTPGGAAAPAPSWHATRPPAGPRPAVPTPTAAPPAPFLRPAVQTKSPPGSAAGRTAPPLVHRAPTVAARLPPLPPGAPTPAAATAPPRAPVSPVSPAQMRPAPPAARVVQCVHIEVDDWEEICRRAGVRPQDRQSLTVLLEKYKDKLAQINWYHGTTSTSLVMALMTDGRMKSAGDLLAEGIAPLSGESGNALSPWSINKKGISGVDLENLEGALFYTSADNVSKGGTRLRTLYRNLITVVEDCKKDIANAIKSENLLNAPMKDIRSIPIQQIRGATIKLSRLVWSLTLFADPDKYQEAINVTIGDFNVFINEVYTSLKLDSPMRPYVVELVETFNRAVDLSSAAAESRTKRKMISREYPVVYAAVGARVQGASSDVVGEVLLPGARFPRRGSSPSGDTIDVVFVPFDRWYTASNALAKRYGCTVLPIELLKVYKAWLALGRPGEGVVVPPPSYYTRGLDRRRF